MRVVQYKSGDIVENDRNTITLNMKVAISNIVESWKRLSIGEVLEKYKDNMSETSILFYEIRDFFKMLDSANKKDSEITSQQIYEGYLHILKRLYYTMKKVN